MKELSKYHTLYESGTCKIIEADIFEVFEESEKAVIIHQANCFHTMGSGVARLIREKYPEAYQADCSTRKGDSNKLGTYSFAKVAENKIIVNFYSQYKFTRDSLGDRDTSYDAFHDCVKGLFSCIKDKEYKILVPYGIASNLAGARFPIILKMIEVLAAYYGIDVVICRLSNQEKLV